MNKITGIPRLRRSALGALAAAAVLLTGCAAEGGFTATYGAAEAAVVESGTVAADGVNELVWDNDVKAVFLHNMETGRIWSTVPYDYYVQQESETYRAMEMKSPLNIRYYALSNRQERSARGSEEAVLAGQVSARLIPGGIRVEYDMPQLSFRIPVEYVLDRGGLRVRLVIRDITEGEDYRLVSVSPAPFLAAVPEGEDTYLFVPSGCGALLYTDVRDGIRRYEEPVYGPDGVEQPATITAHTQPVRLPVFGACAGDHGLVGILEKGAETASIEACAGDERLGWSTVYPTFKLRGSDTTNVQNRETLEREILSYADTPPALDTAEIWYGPLEGDRAGYAGMAAQYRQNLTEQGLLQPQTALGAYGALEFLGGALTEKKILGVAYDRLTPATTAAQVQDILQEIRQETDLPLTAVLTGFGKAGLDRQYIAGGFGFAGAFGKKARWTALADWAVQNDTALFADFDLLYYRKRGSGVSPMGDGAHRANNIVSKHPPYSPVTNREIREGRYDILLRRSRLPDVGQRLMDAVPSLGIPGVSLQSLGQVAYSDYRDPAYYSKNGMGEAAAGILDGLRQQGNPVITGPNAYAAARCDWIWEAPFTDSGFHILDKTVPFYQMVFSGAVPMSSPPANETADPLHTVLQALSLGTVPAFSVSAAYTEEFRYTTHRELAVSSWEGNRELILQAFRSAGDILPRTAGAAIVSYDTEDGVSVTRFDNGVTLYVNYTGEEAPTAAGYVPATGYLLKTEEGR